MVYFWPEVRRTSFVEKSKDKFVYSYEINVLQNRIVYFYDKRRIRLEEDDDG